jgi:hypothetical protein
MTAIGLSGKSTTPPPPANPPSRPPKTPPPPTKPPRKAADLFGLALSLGPDTARDLARPSKTSPPSKPPRKPTNTKPIRAAFPSGNDRAGATTPRPGAVSDGIPAVRARDEGRAGGAVGAATRPPGPPTFPVPGEGVLYDAPPRCPR